MTRKTVLILPGLCMAAVAMAGDIDPDTTATDGIELAGIVVTGTRAPRTLKDTPVQTRLISARDIERTDATDISDVLRQAMPGVEFSYAMNQQVHLNIGGFGGRSVLFLVDGEPLAGETMDDVDFSRIDMANVDHIEIVRGASGALYGSNSGGGVINVITRKPRTAMSGNVGFRLSRHNSRRYVAALSLKGRHVSNVLSLTASCIDSYDVHSAEGAQARVFGTVYGNRTLNVSDRLTWRPVDALSLTGRVGFYMQQVPRSADTPDRYRSYSAGLRGEWRPTPYNDRLEVSYAFDQYDKSQYMRLTGLDVRSYSDVLNTVRAFYTHTTGRGDILSAGADLSHEYLMNTKMDATHTNDSFDFFGQYDARFGDRFEAVGVVRYDYSSDGHHHRVTPKVSLRYTPIRRLTLRAAWGLGFRAPSLKEKYYEFDMAGIWIVKGNPGLKPESAHTVDVSAEYSHGSYSISATAFVNHVQNRIATSLPYSLPDDPKQLYLDYINLSDYMSAGCEITARAAWNNGLRASLSYAFTHERAITDADGNRFNNQYMPTRPHSLTANIDMSRTIRTGYDLTASLSGRFLSAVTNSEYRDYYDIAAGTVSVRYPAYTIWKLAVSQTIAGRFKLNLAADNLFNYKPRYYYLNAPLTDGLTLSAGLTLTI